MELLQACTYFCVDEKTREGLTNTNTGIRFKVDIATRHFLGKKEIKTATHKSRADQLCKRFMIILYLFSLFY